MSKLEVALLCISAVSILFNIGVFAYARMCVANLLSVSEELGDLKTLVLNFSNHISDVYQLEMFYGDQTLKNLVEHARSLDEQLDTFEYIFSLTEQEAESVEFNEEN